MVKKEKAKRQLVDIGELVEQIDQYPEAAGIQSDVWKTLTYAQKARLLIQRQLDTVQGSIDSIEVDEDGE